MPRARQIQNKTLEKSLNSGIVLAACYGVFIGWTMFSGTHRETWNWNISLLELTIVHSSFYASAMIGVIFGVFSYGSLGMLKLQMISTGLALLSSLGYLLVAVTVFQTVITMIISRCIGGFGFGMFFPGFVRKISELSYKTYRGRYTHLSALSVEIGIWAFAVFQYSYTGFETVGKVGGICIILSVLSLVGMVHRQFEPFTYYLLRGDPRQAFNVLTELRDTHTIDEQKVEFAEIEQYISVQQTQSFPKRNISYRIYIYLGLTKIAYVLVSNAFIFNYLQINLFLVTDFYFIKILVFGMMLSRLLISLASYAFVDKIGRQKMMMASAGATGLIFIVLGIIDVTLLTPKSNPNESINWIVFVLFVLLQSAAGIGITTLPDIFNGEVVPFIHRKLVMTPIYVMEYLFFFLFTIFVYSSGNVGFGQGFMFLWGSILLLIGVATKFLIFETNNKSLAEIWSIVMKSTK